MSAYRFKRKQASITLLSIANMLKVSNHPAESSIRIIAKNLVEKKENPRFYVCVDLGSGDSNIVMVWKRTPRGKMKVISFVEAKKSK